MKRRNDQSTFKFNGAIATILLQFCHMFMPPCVKFLLKVCSNHGIIEMDYFILRHGHFVHGYYISVDFLLPNHSGPFGTFFYFKSCVFGIAPNTPCKYFTAILSLLLTFG